MEIKIIYDDGRERTVPDVLDYNFWTKDDIKHELLYEGVFSCSGRQGRIFDKLEVLAEKLAPVMKQKLQERAEYAGGYDFRQILRETLSDMNIKEEQ